MRVIAIWCVDSNGWFADENGDPPYCAEDKRRFKRWTMGHTVVCGYNTKLPELSGRRVIRLDRRLSTDLAHYKFGVDETVFLIGGMKTFQQNMKYCDEAIVTMLFRDEMEKKIESGIHMDEYISPGSIMEMKRMTHIFDTKTRRHVGVEYHFQRQHLTKLPDEN